ncbi:MAG: hypothetical protein AB8I08_02100 [Sandaracinaceae bacterium]
MTPDPFVPAFDALDPEQARFLAMQEHVLGAYDLSQRPLALEWVQITREHPVITGVSLAAAAAALLFATPVGAVLYVLTQWA